ncbi:ABC-type lipoprotein export system ATPase subunit [Devosia sp. UYZn731]|uniref:ABC transporter ATP-binding protein n=1 Tax=Devosia sp. UYZn731 TaxID=3156345 RepID=UPI003398BADD
MTDILVDVARAGRAFANGGTNTIALDSATCRVRPRDRIALVGQSGSGKSTLLHLMAGLDRPTSGTVTWPALGQPETLRPTHVGVVFQSQSLVRWLDVAENVALPLQLAGTAGDARQWAMDALERFGLQHIANKLPEEISGGQAQRVSLVRATMTNPDLLLADEPTGQVDHATAGLLMDMLLQWADQTRSAVVIATHDLAIARRFGQVWHMRGGILSTETESISA